MKLPPEPLLLGVFIYNSAAVFCCSQLCIGSDVLLLDVYKRPGDNQPRPHGTAGKANLMSRIAKPVLHHGTGKGLSLIHIWREPARQGILSWI